jgi:hypothetical protein
LLLPQLLGVLGQRALHLHHLWQHPRLLLRLLLLGLECTLTHLRLLTRQLWQRLLLPQMLGILGRHALHHPLLLLLHLRQHARLLLLWGHLWHLHHSLLLLQHHLW